MSQATAHLKEAQGKLLARRGRLAEQEADEAAQRGKVATIAKARYLHGTL